MAQTAADKERITPHLSPDLCQALRLIAARNKGSKLGDIIEPILRKHPVIKRELEGLAPAK